MMDFATTDEQQLIERTAREYAARALAPRAAERDRTGEFPLAELRELGALGLLGVAVPDELGGSGAGAVAFALAMVELARADASVAVAVSVTNMVAELVARFGTDDQRRRHVPGLVSGAGVCGAFALSEAAAGSDPTAMLTTARRVAGGWRIDGAKQWITSADHAGLLIVWAATDAAAPRPGITAFLVPGGTRGLSVTRREDKLGLNGSSTCQLALEGVEVGDDAVLGDVGGGFKLALTALDGGRIGIAAQALGIGRMAFDAALTYAGDRVQFGVPIVQHQAVGGMLADSATWLDAARLLVLRAAWRKERGLPFGKHAAMAKLFASEKAGQACDLALQIHGGYGYVSDFPIERAYRDVRATRIYEGTSEIQRLVIARHLIKEHARE